MIMENLSPDERAKSMALQWRVKQAPPSSDIIWENMYYKKNILYILILNISLFVLFSLIVNPQLIGSYIEVFLFSNSNARNDLVNTLRLMVQPMVILFFNSIIIPSLCDLIGRLEGHKTKSKRQGAIMKKNFYFQFMNTIIVPLTVNATLSIFFADF